MDIPTICWESASGTQRSRDETVTVHARVRGTRKREFLSDPEYLACKGFAVADTSECGINLMYLPLAQDAEPPRFKACAKHPAVEEQRLCPLIIPTSAQFTYYWVPRVEEAAMSCNRVPLMRSFMLLSGSRHRAYPLR